MEELSLRPEDFEQFADDEAFLKAIQIKKANWEAFIQSRILAAEVNPTIAQSWIRSKSYGIDPFNPHIIHLSDEELAARCEKCRILLQYAKPLMDRLASIGAGHISLMSLHDSDGYMLELNDRMSPESTWRDEFFRPGVRWLEEDVGTNGIGLVLIEKRPIQIIGQEHYCYGQRNVCCCAAPIMDSDDNLVGVLNVCAQVSNFSRHMMTLVILSCYAISNQLKAYSSFEIDKTVLSVISECVMVLDQHLNIIRCSDYAAKLFHTSVDSLIGSHIQELIHIPELSVQLKASGRVGIVCRNCSSYFGGRHLLCDISAKPIYEGSRKLGVVLTVQSSKIIAKKVALTVGNFAKFTFADIPTSYPPLLEMISDMQAKANTPGPVLLLGEKGTGKELYAHAIHAVSELQREPFISVNCEVMPGEALKRELFGCEKGVLSGVFRDGNLGKLELCDGGTLFLDSVDKLTIEIQMLLLRLLTTHRICHCGGKTDIEVNVRIIAATHMDLADLVRRKLFLEKLYYVLRGVVYVIPPLRSRPDDIVLLAERMVNNLNGSEQKEKRLSPELLALLRSNAWPGNGRELSDAVSRAYYCCEGEMIQPEHLEDRYRKSGAADRPSGSREGGNTADRERQKLLRVLRSCDFNVEQAAETLRVSRATMYRWMKKYDIRCKNGGCREMDEIPPQESV